MNVKYLGFCFLFLFLIYFFAIQFSFGGSYFSQSRYYDPKLGQFVQADPVTPSAESKGFNRYSYVYNDPLKLIDPSGNTPVSIQDPSETSLPSPVKPLGQAAQVGSFVLREVLKHQSRLPAIGPPGTGFADGIVLDFLESSPAREFGPKGFQGGVTWDPLTGLDLKVAPGYAIPDEILPSLAPSHPVSPLVFPDDVPFERPTTLHRLAGSNPLAAEVAGLRAGFGQIPLYASSVSELNSNFVQITILARKSAAVLPAGLSGFGGGSAIVAYSSEPNPVMRTLGQTAGGLEVIGGAAYLAGTKTVVASSGATLLTWGSKLMFAGGTMGAGLLAFEFGRSMIQNPPDYGQGLDPIDRRMKTQGGGRRLSDYDKLQEDYRRENKIRDNHPFGGSTR